jgi:protein-S-isoprenylcysteine O-methyltransferase Ste14
MYTGALMIGLGGALFFSSLWGLLCFLIIYSPIFLYRIMVEERYLKKKFGDRYVKYTKKTSRLIPGVY